VISPKHFRSGRFAVYWSLTSTVVGERIPIYFRSALELNPSQVFLFSFAFDETTFLLYKFFLSCLEEEVVLWATQFLVQRMFCLLLLGAAWSWRVIAHDHLCLAPTTVHSVCAFRHPLRIEPIQPSTTYLNIFHACGWSPPCCGYLLAPENISTRWTLLFFQVFVSFHQYVLSASCVSS